jgi:hypothetical protein
MGRISWSLFRHPVKSREFPAEQERLITDDELLRFGFYAQRSTARGPRISVC